MEITVEDLHHEIKNHIAKNSGMWKTETLKYGKTLIKAGDIITKTYYIETGIVKVHAFDEDLQKNIIINLFAAHNPCIPLSLYENKPSPATAITMTRENIIHSIDIKTLKEIAKKEPKVDAFIAWTRERLYFDMFKHRAVASAQLFEKKYEIATKHFPCLKNMGQKDNAEYFGCDTRTIRTIWNNPKKEIKPTKTINEKLAEMQKKQKPKQK